MNPVALNRCAGYGVFGLSIILSFCLVFEQRLEIPPILAWGGHLHPLVLHFPIVLLLLAVVLHWRGERPRKDWLITVASLSALITAISGFLLGQGRAPKGDLLIGHQYLGSALALLAVLWYMLDDLPGFNLLWRRLLMALTGVLVLGAGHSGGSITHGRDFLRLPGFNTATRTDLPEDPEIFGHVIMPVIEDKCLSCHNPDRAKGMLSLSGIDDMLKGGESGPAIVPGDAPGSEFFRRLNLPHSDEAHMPPPDKAQLTSQQIAMIGEWIAAGAPVHVKLSDLDRESALAALITEAGSERISRDHRADIPAIDETRLADLSDHHTTIHRLSSGQNALRLRLYPHSGYRPGDLQKLKKISQNIVEIDMSGLPAGETEIAFAASCRRLEELTINRTHVDDNSLLQLSGNTTIRILRASQTRLSDASIPLLISLQNLQKLSVWGSGISDRGLLELASSRPDLEIIAGIDPEMDFSSILPAPVIDPPLYFFRDSAYVKMRHPLTGIRISYTTNGSIPGSQSPAFRDSLLIKSSMRLRFMASREGWQSSPVDSAYILLSSIVPHRIELMHPANPGYPGRGSESLFDLKKGMANIQDSAWLGFREQPFDLICLFDSAISISAVTLSCLVHTAPHVFPPVQIEVWGGKNRDQMQLLGNREYMPPQSPVRAGFAYYTCNTEIRPVNAIRIRARPLDRLPKWHEAVGQPGWLFIDEVLIEGEGRKSEAI